MSLEEIFSEAKILPNDSRAILAEKLVAGIEDDIDPQVIKSHLAEVKKRRDEKFVSSPLDVPLKLKLRHKKLWILLEKEEKGRTTAFNRPR
jgi:hypothetical protein